MGNCFAISLSETKGERSMKENIGVIFGGCSSEYGVSLHSASAVIKNLDREKYNLVLIGITGKGDWYYFEGAEENIENDTWFNEADCTPVCILPNKNDRKMLVYKDGKVTKEICLDKAFPVLHGKNGEDGTVQGLLELAGIPVVGCNLLSSAICMDKYRAHKLVEGVGVRVAKSAVFSDTVPMDLIMEDVDALVKETGFPVFVKPVKAGSSYGITKVYKKEMLSDAVKSAFEFDNQVIIEENIEGFEVGCAVMGNEDLTVGEVDEIELSKGFFDYTEKYNLITSAIHVPARISVEKAEKIKKTAMLIYRVLGCCGFARVDMFLTPDGEIVFNEVNTIPGFTEHSRFPGMMKARGISFSQILDTVIGLAK